MYQRKGDNAKAIEAYRQVAEMFANEGFDAKSVAIYKQILRIDPASIDARVRLGDLYQRLGLPSDALLQFQAGVKVYQERGQKAEAFELLKRVAALDPTNLQNRLSLADLLVREGMKTEAKEEYESLLVDLERRGDFEGLERVATQILESFPGHPAALNAFAKAKIELGTAAEAAEELRKALPKLPEDLALREALVSVYEAMGDEEGLQSLYREMAELYKRRGDAERAREILQRFVPVEPFAAPDTSPSMELEMEQQRELVLAPSQTSEVDPLAHEEDPVTPPVTGSTPEDLLAEACVHLEFDNLDQAEHAGRQILTLDSASDGARSLLAEIAHKRGDRAEALRLHRERADLATALGEAELLAEIEDVIREINAETTEPGAEPEPESIPAPAKVEAKVPESRSADSLPDIELVLEDDDDADDALASVEPPPELLETQPTANDPAELEISSDEFELDDGEPEVAVEAPAVSSFSGSLDSDSSVIAEQLQEAQFYFDQGMHEDAERILRAVLKRVPQHPQALLRLGEIASLRGDAPELEALKPLEETAVQDGDEVPSMPELSFDSVEVEEEEEEEPVEAAPSPEEAELVEAAPSPEEPEPADAVPASPEELEPLPADDEGGGFDLAAELDGDADAAAASSAADTAFDEVFNAFKKGIEEQLDEGECDAHYDLAIAYREMGLLDDAIRELEIVQRTGRELEALSLIAGCKLELDRPEEAIVHLRAALKLPDAQGEGAIPIYFDLGLALVATGETGEAKGLFEKVAESDPEFRDVQRRLKELEKVGG